MPNYQQWRIYSVPPVSASLEIQSFAGIFPLHFFHLHSSQASTANTTGPKLGHLRSASFFLIPCRLVTSPLTQARSLTPPLQLFLAHSFNQPDTGLHCTSLRTTFQMKRGGPAPLLLYFQGLHMSRSSQMDSCLGAVVLPASRWTVELYTLQENPSQRTASLL